VFGAEEFGDEAKHRSTSRRWNDPTTVVQRRWTDKLGEYLGRCKQYTAGYYRRQSALSPLPARTRRGPLLAPGTAIIRDFENIFVPLLCFCTNTIIIIINDD
jgi:hypothetical protein